ncbi:cytochrome P450 [Lactarius indigo]|nr:cytochrome P450 [Lactarius indigo]
MPISLVTAFDCLALAAFLYTLFAFRDHRRRRGFPYPPGPPSWPVIGNFLDVPKFSPWLAYANMSKEYGDVVCLQVFGQVVIALCSSTAIKDLLERRGELMGKHWREGRRLLDRSFRPGATALHRRLIEEKTRGFLGQLLVTPDAFREHLNLLQGKLVMRLTYGYDLKDNDDILAQPKRIGEILKPFFLPGAALVNHLPFLRRLPSWVPWFKYEPLAGECRELARRMKNEPMDFRDGTAVRSLATEYLKEADLLNGLERQQAMEGIRDMLGSSVPSAYVGRQLRSKKRAQAELDSVISRDRLPTYDDKPRLPYIEAISKELTRWHVVAPMGAGSSLINSDVTLFQKVPWSWLTHGARQSYVTLALQKVLRWIDRAVLHDPELYPDPEIFDPNRFLNEDGSFRDDPTISLVFGAGRRICPARHLADTTLFIVTASVLSIFNVTKAKDKDGNEIPVAVPPLDSILPDIAIGLDKGKCLGLNITPAAHPPGAAASTIIAETAELLFTCGNNYLRLLTQANMLVANTAGNDYLLQPMNVSMLVRSSSAATCSDGHAGGHYDKADPTLDPVWLLVE